jgi:hypothetical protein
MTDATMTDPAFLACLLTQLRMPSIARNWRRIAETADREGWPAQRTIAALMEIEGERLRAASSVIASNPSRRRAKPSPASISTPRRSCENSNVWRSAPAQTESRTAIICRCSAKATRAIATLWRRSATR